MDCPSKAGVFTQWNLVMFLGLQVDSLNKPFFPWNSRHFHRSWHWLGRIDWQRPFPATCWFRDGSVCLLWGCTCGGSSWATSSYKLRGGFKYVSMFTPIWGRLPFWLIFFKWVWNHQLARLWWFWWDLRTCVLFFTTWKFNSSPLRLYRAPKGQSVVFHTSFFRGELLNFGRVTDFDTQNYLPSGVEHGAQLKSNDGEVQSIWGISPNTDLEFNSILQLAFL